MSLRDDKAKDLDLETVISVVFADLLKSSQGMVSHESLMHVYSHSGKSYVPISAESSCCLELISTKP